jgi:hypothetical protein
LTITFLHSTPQQINQFCKEISVYDVKEYIDSHGTRIKEEQKLSSYKVKIKSFNDLIQYDTKDALFLTEEQGNKLI